MCYFIKYSSRNILIRILVNRYTEKNSFELNVKFIQNQFIFEKSSAFSVWEYQKTEIGTKPI